jgi:hypothetical protein
MEHVSFVPPENWLSEGEHFSNDYILLPSGLLSAPRLIRKKECE